MCGVTTVDEDKRLGEVPLPGRRWIQEKPEVEHGAIPLSFAIARALVQPTVAGRKSVASPVVGFDLNMIIECSIKVTEIIFTCNLFTR